MSYYRDEAPPRERSSQHYYRDDRREERDPRYLETRETHLRVHPSHDLVPRTREDSDLSVEEIRRDFPPPGYRQGDVHRARSADPRYYDDYDDRRSHYSKDRGYDRDRERGLEKRTKSGTSLYYEEEEKKKRRMLTKQEKIIAALVGGALVVGGKELYDRHDAKKDGSSGEVHRNPMSSAALGAAGALAAYQSADFYNKHANKEEQKSTHIIHKDRDGKIVEYYSDDDGGGASEKKGNKNFLESALAAAGLGSAVKALTGHDDKDKDKDKRSDTRSRRGSRSRSRSKSPSKPDPSSRIQKAAMASLIAGATEAFRVAKQPGGWQGEKAKRVFTAAVGAATIDAATNQNSEKSSKLGLAESVIGGLLGNRVLNGSKKNIEEDHGTGRSRSRSRARSQSKGGGGGGGVGGLAALATAGLGALGAKKIMDGRDKSRSPSRSRRRSADSSDSRDGSPRRKRSRSRSVVDSARRSLAKIGIGKGPDDDESPRDSTRRRNNDFIDDDYPQPRDRGSARRDHDYDDDRSYRGGAAGRGGGGGGGRDRSRSRQRGGRRGSFSGSDTDLGDSSEDEKQARRKKAPPRSERFGDDGGPRYYDGNPYAASSLPAPPVGYSRR